MLARKSPWASVVVTRIPVPALAVAYVPVVLVTVAPSPLTNPASWKLAGFSVAIRVPSYVFEADPTSDAVTTTVDNGAGLIVSAVALPGACAKLKL